MRYAPLHNHTVYSIKDAIAKPKDYVKFIHEYNSKNNEHEMVALAITEHGNTFSLYKHHAACNEEYGEEKKKLKAIYGNEVYHIDDLSKSKGCTGNDRYHLVLLAKNEEGLKNLYKITTHAGLNKVKKTKEFQLTTLDFIKEHGKGLIGLSACVSGKIGQLILKGEYEKAKQLAIDLNNSLDEFYLEIQPHDNFPEQMLINDALLCINSETNIPLVITSDSHYVTKEDKKYHDLMKDIDHSNHFTTQNHMWTVEELIDWCNEYEIPLEAIENTAKVADKCTADITPTDEKGLMPDFNCPKGYTQDSYLIKLANDGLRDKIAKNKNINKDIDTYIKRLLYELDVITQMGFSGYFLILWDWLKWCKENDVLFGPGRGSAAGSIVAYCLGITRRDPIKNGLIFERFLNPERKEFPDYCIVA